MKFGIITCEDGDNIGGEEGQANFMLQRFDNHDGSNPDNSNHDNRKHEWNVIHGVSGSLPTVEEMKNYNGFVICGAHYSVNDQHQWIRNLENFVRDIDKNNRNSDKNTKLYGICFGHQLIASAFGGKITRNSKLNFIFGSDKVSLDETVTGEKWFRDVFGEDQKHFTIMQSHGERVSEVPHNAVVCGRSERCDVEVLKYGDNILSSQGHPEFTEKFMKEVLMPSKTMLTDEEKEEAVREFPLADQDHMVQLVTNFLSQ